MRTSISPVPRLVYMPLNMSVCMRTFTHACRSCDSSVTMSFSKLRHIHRWRSPVPRLVYIPLNMSICMRTFTHARRSCVTSVSTTECCPCLKMRSELCSTSMSFSQLPHMRRRRTPVPRLLYIPLNMPISMRTFRHACRSCESSVSTKKSVSLVLKCLRNCGDQPWFSPNFHTCAEGDYLFLD